MATTNTTSRPRSVDLLLLLLFIIHRKKQDKIHSCMYRLTWATAQFVAQSCQVVAPHLAAALRGHLVSLTRNKSHSCTWNHAESSPGVSTFACSIHTLSYTKKWNAHGRAQIPAFPMVLGACLEPFSKDIQRWLEHCHWPLHSNSPTTLTGFITHLSPRMWLFNDFSSIDVIVYCHKQVRLWWRITRDQLLIS